MALASTRSRGARIALLASMPAALGLMLFLLVPFLMAFVLTFTNQRLIASQPGQFVGGRNYARLLSVSYIVQQPEPGSATPTVYPRIRSLTRVDPQYYGYRPFTRFQFGQDRVTILAKDPDFLRSLLNTFTFALMVVPLQCLMALALALLVNAGLRGQNLFRASYFSPVVMSMVVVSIVWTFLFDRDLGSINKLLSFLTLGTVRPIDWLGDPSSALPAIALMSAWQGAGFQMLIFLAGLQGIPEEQYDAARVDGAKSWQRFWHVTIPGLRQTTAFVIVVTTIAALGLFTQIDVMTQGGPQNSTSTVMFHAIQHGVREGNIAYGSTVAVVYFTLITVLILVQQAVQRRWSR